MAAGVMLQTRAASLASRQLAAARRPLSTAFSPSPHFDPTSPGGEVRRPTLLASTRRRLWHPYTSATAPSPCLPVASASGVRLTLEDGRALVDGMSSWWAAVHG